MKTPTSRSNVSREVHDVLAPPHSDTHRNTLFLFPSHCHYHPHRFPGYMPAITPVKI